MQEQTEEYVEHVTGLNYVCCISKGWLGGHQRAEEDALLGM